MGWAFDKADWSAVEGAYYMGAGGSMPGIWTLIAVCACVAVLAIGQIHEKAKYNKS